VGVSGNVKSFQEDKNRANVSADIFLNILPENCGARFGYYHVLTIKEKVAELAFVKSVSCCPVLYRV